ncbi:DUF481 domain-containing protein [Pararhodonellum marinum]|uniref:DUF481 domain-containing protein n=1 Tax=Pararhodonellum marinum TaxID=2755358 RepID=UPI00188F7178|nr:DUF481 domain-containing protein [Pararhodonellum marinum]
MSKFLCIGFCLLSFSFLAQAQERDTVYLRNGQIMVGKLNKISLGTIEFDDVDLNIQNVRYHKIRTLKAATRTFRIETIDKSIYFGVIKPSNVFGEVIVDDGFVEQTYHLDQIYQLVSLEKKFIKKIKGTVSAGYSYTKNSDIGRTNFDWNLHMDEEKFQADFMGSFIFTNNQGEKSRDRENISLVGFYNFSTVLVGGIYFNYQRNIELGLASRLQQGVGFGRRILMKSNLQGMLVTGGVINQERDLAGNSSGSLYEIPLNFRLNYFHYSAPNLQFVFNPRVFFGVNQDGRLRFDGDITVNWEVINNLNLGIQTYTNYDNRALEGSNTNFDYGLVLNIGYKFK